jgi:ABC-type lipopolysaccharide export system ATPase subunit
MHRLLLALSIGIFAILSAQDSSRAQGTASSKPKAPETQFVVLSPWADVDPIPLRGITPRISTLAGKKIGLFVNPKRAAMPIAESIDRRLKTMYPDVQTIVFHSTEANVNEMETKNKEKFTAWAKGLDAAIAVVGD